MKKYRFELILFIVDAISMIVELVASRILSPYFGNSNLVWTSVIGIILLSSSIGNYLGGKIADGKEIDKKLKFILAATTLFVLVIPLVQNLAIQNVVALTSDIKVGAILSTVVLFFVPSLLMGLLTPIIVKLKLNSLETAGAVSGRINAIATIGGIIGTFLGGFYLIPYFGSIEILFLLAVVLALSLFLVDFKFEIKAVVFVGIIVVVSLFPMISFTRTNNENGDIVRSGKMGESVSYDTQYGRVLIYNSFIDGDAVRVLNIDSGYESITFTSPNKRNELVSAYTKYYDLMFSSEREIKDCLMIGGAGYSYPKYYISHFEDRNMDVIEIDGEITELAKKYFYLDDLIKEYDLENTQRLHLITEDGRTYLNNNQKKYDAVLNDAFSGSSPAKTLTTVEAVSHIKRSLNENGVYLTNIISSLEGENSQFLRAEVNTLRQVFKNVYIIPCKNAEDLETVQNSMVIATDSDLVFEGVYDLQIEEDEIILSDNYCPVDSLIPYS